MTNRSAVYAYLANASTHSHARVKMDGRGVRATSHTATKRVCMERAVLRIRASAMTCGKGRSAIGPSAATRANMAVAQPPIRAPVTTAGKGRRAAYWIMGRSVGDIRPTAPASP